MALRFGGWRPRKAWLKDDREMPYYYQFITAIDLGSKAISSSLTILILHVGLHDLIVIAIDPMRTKSRRRFRQ